MKKARSAPGKAKGRKSTRVASASRVVDQTGDDEMRAEYDFSGGVRGKYADRFAAGQPVRVVVLAPDVADGFASAQAVNRALRGVLKARAPAAPATRASRRTGNER
jgi:hypothetical protein